MSDQTRIEWTDATWNPVTGCSKVSPGCEHCYAERLSHRFGWTQQPWTAPHAAANVRWHADRLQQPRQWRRPRRIFVNSLSDLFHPAVPDTFLGAVFATMQATPRHTYQILTKRPARMREWMQQPPPEVAGAPWPPPNVWLGVSVEDARRADERIPVLRDTPAAIRFLSCEPLLGPLDLTGALGAPGAAPEIAWVIVGAESGPQARAMDDAWVRTIRDACLQSGTAFFFKQRATAGHKEPLPWLDGRQWHEWPEPAQEGGR